MCCPFRWTAWGRWDDVLLMNQSTRASVVPPCCPSRLPPMQVATWRRLFTVHRRSRVLQYLAGACTVACTGNQLRMPTAKQAGEACHLLQVYVSTMEAKKYPISATQW